VVVASESEGVTKCLVRSVRHDIRHQRAEQCLPYKAAVASIEAGLFVGAL